MENFDWTFLSVDLYDVGLLATGLIILVAVILPRLVSARKMITAPMLYMAIGALIFMLPWAPRLPDIIDHVRWPKRLTELGVIIALTSAGLKLNRPYSRETWQVSWRLLAITMPLTIVATALAGWWAAGLVPASALLLGSVIASTDPLLASNVQISSPDKPDDSKVRLALTTEAGLNDGLAFPFTNLAVILALAGLTPVDWLFGWLLVDVLYKIIVGTLAGAFSGWLIGVLLFKLPATQHLAKTMTGVAVLSLTLVTYGLAELLSSYGFIAVFVAACVFRQLECGHQYHNTLHEVSEEAERVLIAILMILIGAYSVSGLMAHMTLSMWLLAAVVVFVIRPTTGLLGLFGTKLSMRERWAVSFFGIRGIGSIYYLAYGIDQAKFPRATTLWALVVAIIIISVIVHGCTAKPVMAWVTSSLRSRMRNKE